MTASTNRKPIKNPGSIFSNIHALIQQSKNILIVISRPVDPDTVGTAFALEWLLTLASKQVHVVSFTRIPSNMADFPCIRRVDAAGTDSFSFSPYNLIILIDGSSWDQFFGRNWKQTLKKFPASKIINLDHHDPGQIQMAVPERCLVAETSSTAQLLFDYFIRPFNLKLPPEIAHYLYLALLYDTRMFKNEMFPGMYLFAHDLLTLGADHLKAVDKSYDLKEIDFTVWAVEHTEFIPALQLTMLVIDAGLNIELQKKLGENWMDFDGLYKETIERQIKGYNYGIILIDNMDGTIRFGWRTRNFGNYISIAEVAHRAGFSAGGHRNAGGGSFDGTIEHAKTSFLQEIRRALNIET